MIWKKDKKIKQKKNEKLQNIIKEYKSNKNQFQAKEMLKLYNQCKPKNMFDIKGHRNKLISKYKKLSAFLINMQLSNGNTMQFIVKVTDGGFRFDKGFYIIDDELKYFMATSNMYALDYHEELCFPVSRKIEVSNLKDELIQSNDVELKTTINPVSLEYFMQSSVIQKLLSGAELDQALRFIKMGVIIIGIAVFIILLINLSLAGIF